MYYIWNLKMWGKVPRGNLAAEPVRLEKTASLTIVEKRDSFPRPRVLKISANTPGVLPPTTKDPNYYCFNPKTTNYSGLKSLLAVP
jgi:hypothetical protein